MGKESLLEVTEICAGELRELGVKAGVIEEGLKFGAGGVAERGSSIRETEGCGDGWRRLGRGSGGRGGKAGAEWVGAANIAGGARGASGAGTSREGL